MPELPADCLPVRGRLHRASQKEASRGSSAAYAPSPPFQADELVRHDGAGGNKRLETRDRKGEGMDALSGLHMESVYRVDHKRKCLLHSAHALAVLLLVGLVDLYLQFLNIRFESPLLCTNMYE